MRSSLVENYAKYCPLECDSMSFTVSERPLSKGATNDSYALLYAYYRTLKYTSITQMPEIALIDQIAYIGGILGLFLGCSFLSFIEIVEFISEVIFNFFENNVAESKLFSKKITFQVRSESNQ